MKWRDEEIRRAWGQFSTQNIDGKDVLDFGCGDGQLSLYLAGTSRPRSVTGIDIDVDAIKFARQSLATSGEQLNTPNVSFEFGEAGHMPVDDCSIDTILAFDCMEHVMDPDAILAEWHRVLRPGGNVLIEWFPFKGPYGAHMSNLIPMPWAHVIFGDKAMFETAARIYDAEDFVPQHWDLDEDGNKRPNKWAQFSSFHEQAYLNELTIPQFKAISAKNGFETIRFEKCGFGQSGPKAAIGKVLLGLPLINEYFVNYSLIELQK